MTSTTTIRLTADERSALDAAADAAGLGPSSFARRAVMQAINRNASVRRRPTAVAQAIGMTLGALGRIGGNVNQLARWANSGGRVPADALAAVRTELAALTAAIMSLREPGG